jgi:hypothetical protein
MSRHADDRTPQVHVHWSKTWTAALDAALDALPESECCPRDLYRLLSSDRDPRKIFALVEDRHGEPFGVVALRFREANGDWVPLTHHILPGLVFPTQEGALPAVLSALRKNVWVVFWRMAPCAELLRSVRTVEVTPTYEVLYATDGRQHWHNANTIRSARTRCQDLEVRIDAEHMARWVIERWEEKWRRVPTETRFDLQDRILAAEFLERRGRSHTLTLHDGDRPVAGITMPVHGRALVGHHTFRDPAYDARGVGTHVMATAMQWGVDAGFERFDLGGDHDAYKRRWASVGGSWTTVYLSPAYLHIARCAGDLLDSVRHGGFRAALRHAADKVLGRRRGDHLPEG